MIDFVSLAFFFLPLYFCLFVFVCLSICLLILSPCPPFLSFCLPLSSLSPCLSACLLILSPCPFFSFCLSVCLSVCLSLSLSVCLLILSPYPPFSPSVSVCLSLSVCLSVCLLFLSPCPFILFFSLSASLFFCLPVFVSACLS